VKGLDCFCGGRGRKKTGTSYIAKRGEASLYWDWPKKEKKKKVGLDQLENLKERGGWGLTAYGGREAGNLWDRGKGL